ncbi:hypothetical protein BDV36DRAFT_262464 [Aspergillus pseudocaelatus]|uniref:Uncharacterized protein n=1 Tax=Aspergillus pseudocaelatus TaxID=1825620 RepID=A0ABQ6WEX8_9EURO|nr:hypothetical protein BDV36DRAFT_262464 [Aspergillus pseudocaelatus]
MELRRDAGINTPNAVTSCAISRRKNCVNKLFSSRQRVSHCIPQKSYAHRSVYYNPTHLTFLVVREK